MVEYEFVTFPEDFTQLFKVNMESTGKHFKSLPAKGPLNKSFYNLAKFSFPDIQGEFDLSSILKKLGWHGLRDRMTAQYLGFLKFGSYGPKVDMRRVQELQDIELQFAPFRVQGYSRAYLLGLYFKIWTLQGKNPGYAQEMLDLLKGDEISNILKDYSARVVGIDWIIISVLLFREHFGAQDLKDVLSSGKTFRKILSDIDEKPRSMILRNMMYYSLSIGDESMILKLLPQ